MGAATAHRSSKYSVVKKVLLLSCAAVVALAYSKRTTVRPFLVGVRLNDEAILVRKDPPKVLWMADLHDGTRVDFPSQWMELGHAVLNMGIKQRNGPYPIPLSKMEYPSRPLSSVAVHYSSHSTKLTESMAREFFEYYKDDPDLLRADAFLCQFPPAYCQMYLPFNKTIIIIASHRIFLGRCTSAESSRLVQHLHSMTKNNTGVENVIAASNVYDSEYLNFFTGLKVPVIPASSFGYQTCAYKPEREEIIIGPTQRESIPAFLADHFAKSKFQYTLMRTLYGRYDTEDLCKHRAFVMVPYAVHSYGFVEVYSLSIPIFAPTIELAVKENIFDDKNVNDEYYCGRNASLPPRASTTHPFSPEDTTSEAVKYWLQFADMYQLPHIQYFNTYQELERLLEDTNFFEVHKKMKLYNNQRRQAIRAKIHDIARSCSKGQASRNWTEAIKPWGSTLME